MENKKVNLVTLRCPSCGGTIEAEDDNKKLVCQYCNSLIVPTQSQDVSNHLTQNLSIKIDGINNPDSGIAYVLQFFQNFDWEVYRLDTGNYHIESVDRLVENLKVTSADHPMTWKIEYESIAYPIEQKLLGVKQLIETIEKQYDSFISTSLYSKFDNHQALVLSLKRSRKSILSHLESSIKLAVQYNLDENLVIEMKDRMSKIDKDIQALEYYTSIEDIPAITRKKELLDQQLHEELYKIGIHASEVYQKAVELENQGNHKEALDTFLLIRNYKDVNKYITNIQKVYRFDMYIEIANQSFILSQPPVYGGRPQQIYARNLYRVIDNIGKNPVVVSSIYRWLNTYADRIFYINSRYEICMYSPDLHKEKVLGKFVGDVSKFNTFSNELETINWFVVSKQTPATNTQTPQKNGQINQTNPNRAFVAQMNYQEASFSHLINEIFELVTITKNKVVYYAVKYLEKEKKYEQHERLYVYDIESKETIEIGNHLTTFQQFHEDQAIILQKQGVGENYDLMIFDLNKKQSKIIEKNVYDFFKVINQRLYYNVGNENNNSLISNDVNALSRTQIMRFMKEVLFVHEDYLYILQGNRYNTGLVRFDTNNGHINLVISKFKEIYQFKYGYIFYLDKENSLCRVRFDGSNMQILSEDIGQLVDIRNNYIYYSIVDEYKTTAVLNYQKEIKSLYRMNADGTAKQKLAYDIIEAKPHDENSIDYIIATTGEYQKMLMRIDTETLESKQITYLAVERTPQKLKSVAFILGLFFGIFGLHNFYLGYVIKGIVQLTVSILALALSIYYVLIIVYAIALVEIIMVLAGYTKKTKQGIILE